MTEDTDEIIRRSTRPAEPHRGVRWKSLADSRQEQQRRQPEKLGTVARSLGEIR